MSEGAIATTSDVEPVLVRPRHGTFNVAPPSDSPRRFHASMPGYAPTAAA